MLKEKTTRGRARTRREASTGWPARLVLRRLITAAAILLVVSLVVFFLTQALPGDVVHQILGQTATDEQIARLRAELGLDRPLVAQYLDWFSGILRLDFGTSLTSGTPVADLVGDRMAATLVLVAVTAAILLPVAFTLGTLAARRPGGVLDHLVSGAATVLLSLPEFVVGILLVLLLATNIWPVLPPTSVVSGNQRVWDDPRLMVLPVLTLVLTAMPYLTESVKTAVRDELASDHIRWARLSGIGERRILLRHALPNAVGPSLQVSAMTLTYLLGGTVTIEVVFAYPGLGSALVSAVADRDVTVVQGIVMVVAALSLLLYLLVDLLGALAAPRSKGRAG
ncbi:ABC transporter permease [Acrocarpospora catenulata]|uniref:ABC transporter permease n=1 Tax=Acrocarpospora catenulata TaxID=2836182 RepID=UPI001BD9A0C8|nr:ABC transporter permease [Acrocarpospora catenulata]